MDEFFDGNSVHAGPISTRMWIVAFFSMLAYGFFYDQFSFAWAAGSFAMAAAIAGATYIFVYLFEVWATNEKEIKALREKAEALERRSSLPINAGVSDPKNFIAINTNNINQKAREMGLAVTGDDANDLIIVPEVELTVGKLKRLIAAEKSGMEHISLRNLEAYGVVTNRLYPEGKDMIDKLLRVGLIKDIGNSQYSFSPTFTTDLLTYIYRRNRRNTD